MNILDGLEAEIKRTMRLAVDSDRRDLLTLKKMWLNAEKAQKSGNTMDIVKAYNQLKAIR
ncbi:MAG: hypothetical protein ACXVIY_00945 [Mucilaginibacter sp.]